MLPSILGTPQARVATCDPKQHVQPCRRRKVSEHLGEVSRPHLFVATCYSCHMCRQACYSIEPISLPQYIRIQCILEAFPNAVSDGLLEILQILTMCDLQL